MLTAQLMRAGSQAQKITLQPLREIYFEESELAMPPTDDTQETPFRVLNPWLRWRTEGSSFRLPRSRRPGERIAPHTGTRASAPAFARVSPKLSAHGRGHEDRGDGFRRAGRLLRRAAGAGRRGRALHRPRQAPAAMRESGLRIEGGPSRSMCRKVSATDDPAEIGVVDLVMFCVKLWDTESALEMIRPMVGPAPPSSRSRTAC